MPLTMPGTLRRTTRRIPLTGPVIPPVVTGPVAALDSCNDAYHRPAGKASWKGICGEGCAEILADWRSAERELDSAHDEQIRVALAARIEVLRLEHAAALEQLDVEAHELSRYPAPKRPPSA